jgi:meso-butanediol dehydrogenase/(S,S)-butanediol dehydrogenase/diacetyl reductase
VYLFLPQMLQCNPKRLLDIDITRKNNQEEKMAGLLQGKIALITGGGTGIGAACARLFAQSGAVVSVMGRRKAPIDRIAKEINGLAVQGDASLEKDCEQAVQATVKAYGGLDTLVSCAGIMSEGNVADLVKSDWDHIIDVNLTSVMLIARAAIPAMRRRSACSIVNVSSLGGLVAPGNMAGYIASKTALIGLSRSMAVDFGPHIRVNALCPGWVLTPMSEEEMKNFAASKNISRQEAEAHVTRFLPLKRMAEPEEIAKCARFLCSNDASFITGTTLVADGGSSAVDVGYISMAY